MKDDSRLDQLFADALQQPPAVRNDFVSSACGPDDALRQELLSLLTAAEASGEFMTTSALDRLAEDVARDGWTIRAGERVGAYTILRLLGSGGAGHVWCARDERLGREVAIKMLLPFYASDPDRLRRFADEARLAGALNHSNILAVYDVGEHHGAPFLVSECLEGETLRERLAKGPIPVDKAVAIALHIVRGLVAAHARGILHRDLKPENVFLRTDGGVKILDFGVAKLLPSSDAPDDPSHTVAAIVGTAGYMAPEQVTGARTDARADLFALGVVLYEMLCGTRPFQRSSTMEALEAVLTAEPSALTSVNPMVPEALADIVHRLLDKNPEGRFQSAVDLAWALERVPATSTEPRPRPLTPAAPALARTRWMPWAAAAVAMLALAGWTVYRPEASERSALEPVTFSLPLPSGFSLDSQPAVSPDNRHIAVTAIDKAGASRILVRELGQEAFAPIAGTEDAKQPFWSPDGRSIGFFAKGRLLRVALDGGAPVDLAPAPDARGGSWSRSDTIVFQPDFRDTPLSRVSARGGAVEPATSLDVTGPDVAHRWPVMLPDGVHFLYLVVSTDETRRGVYLGSLASGKPEPSTRLFGSSSGPAYISTSESAGTVLSAEGRWVEARSFDLSRLAITGDPRKIELAAVGASPHHAALLGVSADVLAFTSTPIPYGAHVASVNTTGDELRLWPEQELGFFLRLSPDKDRLAKVHVEPAIGNPDIWVHDLKRGGRLKVSTSRDIDVLPAWSPDSSRIAYRSGTNEAPILVITAADGSGVVKTLRCPKPYCEPTDWSKDGSLIVNVSGGDVWTVPTESGVDPRPLLDKPFTERDARISSDGLWIAYVSDESGHAEVSVQSLSGPSRRYQPSTLGGDQPVWSRDGTELFYVNPEGFLHSVSARRTSDGGLQLGVPRRLNVPRFSERHWGTTYDVSADGRVYFPAPGDEPFPHAIDVRLGWRTLLK